MEELYRFDHLRNDSVLHLPGPLTNEFRRILNDLNMTEEAKTMLPESEEIIGGASEEAAVKHFVHRFKASCARTSYVTIDPNKTFAPDSLTILSSILDGEVALLDIPCGCGGGLFGILTTIARMRELGHIAKTPINLSITSGDISTHSMKIHEDIYYGLNEYYARQNLRINIKHQEWNVEDRLSTAKLAGDWKKRSPNADFFLILVTAFSGYTRKNSTNASHVYTALSDIALQLYDANNIHYLWIEPLLKNKSTLFKRAQESLAGIFFRKPKEQCEDPASPEESFLYKHPLSPDIITGRAKTYAFKAQPR